MLATIASMFVIPPVWRLAPRFGLLDLPDPRKVHAAPIPRVGGWGIVVGMLLPLVLWLKLEPLWQSFVIGAVTLFAFGVWDDAREISHWPKFLGQIGAAVLVVYYGDLYVTQLPFFSDALNPAIGRPFTVFALVGAINAINHSDGLDGLAAGECLLSLTGLAVLGYLCNSPLTVGVAVAAVGGILGFLRYNSHPARVFMGDAGSQVLGFTVAFLTIYLTRVADSALSPALPLLLLGVPLSDIIVVLYRRISGHMNWFKASRNHVHHRLLDLGFRHFETVIIIYCVQAFLVVSAVLLRYESDLSVAGVYLLAIAALFGALWLGERRGWRSAKRDAKAARPWSLMIERLARGPLVRRLPRLFIMISVPVLLLLGPMGVAHVPGDVALVAALLAVVIGTQVGRSRADTSVLVRFVVYVAAIATVYLYVIAPSTAQHPLQPIILGLIATLAIAIGCYVKFSSDYRFDTTPTDYLILFVVLALLVFGNLDIGVRALVEVVAYAVILLYSCEVLIGITSGSRWNVLHLSAFASLTLIALRGIR